MARVVLTDCFIKPRKPAPAGSLFAAATLLAFLLPAILQAQPVGRITGVGGIFVTSRHPTALAAWYRDTLGITLQQWGGAAFPYDAPGHPPMVLWNAMPIGSDEIAPSKGEFMINFAVDDLDAFVAKLKKKNVAILKQDDADPYGKFAWIMDPDGTKIELWQPITKR